MIKAQRSDGAQSDSVYDALGQRVAAKVNNSWQHFVYDISGQMVAEYGTPSESKGAVSYIHKDNQGSTRVTTNASGWISSRSDYTAFGDEIIAGVGQGRTATAGYNANSIRQKYALTQRDDFTSLDHTPWRKLNTSSGRWTSPDPYKGSMSLGDPQSFNRYSYVNNDPVNFIDPSGLQMRYYEVNAGLSCVLDDRDGKFHCIENIYRYWYDDGTGYGGDSRGIDSSGGGGRVGRETADDKLPFNNCAQFVDYLAGLATGILNSSINGRKTGLNIADATAVLGAEMMKTAQFSKPSYMSNGYDGMKDDLVRWGGGGGKYSKGSDGPQGAGAYGHVMAYAGAYLNGVLGTIAGMVNYQYDNIQVLAGNNKQAPSEVAGDNAGWEVGKHMWNYIRGGKKSEEYRLKNSLTSELCQ